MADQREILERVARGELSPEEAVALLDRDDPSAQPSVEPDAVEAEPEPLFPDVEVREIRLRGAFRTVTVVGDPTVRTASVDGTHTARVDGKTLVIDGDEPHTEGFRFESRRGRFQFDTGGRRARKHIQIGVDNPRPVPLLVRANPGLDLDAEVAAGTLKVHGMRARVVAQVSAGALVLDDVTGPLDLSTAAGPIKVRGRFDAGEHRIRCEAGAVKVVLEPGSDVHVRARASLGKTVLPGMRSPGGFAIGNTVSEATIGAGAASMTIDCSVGGIKVALAEEEEH